MKEYPISRAFADARIQKIYGGTSEIMLELISRDSLAINHDFVENRASID